ncbi:TPR repeat-containing protein [Cryptosporidium muris RN66]|uniref:TPR repeat-containing protein n=1 Tax=Cryptosporidium muris (strain RN66) TaxID=441375 RepID=B6AHL2_CRYMR|nr:TPR repeat-containing protein [Cryptosporidium muris RN66]EEA07707.1 TPR repeat-containing protein [Cryptosporidium muris RN66]|eukprot:XP_002142056.1 TPR repeat-containing protein [Cryptosporidium muris RN66]
MRENNIDVNVQTTNEDDNFDWEVDPERLKHLVEKYKGEEFPLFMGEDVLDSNNVHIQALQSLIYDDETPESLAEQFRIVGNEYFQDGPKRYKDAILSYTRGIRQNSNNKKINSLLYSNRAHIYLLMKRYVDCVNDCRYSLQEDPTNIKAAYRGAKASLEMHLFRQSLNFVNHGLKYDNNNEELLKLYQLSRDKLECIEEKRKILDLNNEDRSQKDKVQLIIKERNYQLNEAIYDAIYTHHHNINLKNNELIFPIMILLDEVMLCEFICEANENSKISDHLKIMFPGDRFLEWDSQKVYVWNKLSIFYESGYPYEHTVWEVSINKTIKEILDQIKIIPKCPTFHIIASSSQYIQEFTNTIYKVIKDPSLIS